MSKRYKAVIGLIFAALVVLLSFYSSEQSSPLHGTDKQRSVILSDSRARHILYGDDSGGGHRYGAAKPCKSEFPEDWDDARILETARRIAANDNLDWEQQDNGYYVAESFEGGVKVRLVLGREQQRIITSYPVNVKRNPCY